MLEARFVNDATSFKRLIDSIKDIVKEVNLVWTPEGIRMQSMDSSHVCLVFFFLPKHDAFSHYTCDTEHVVGLSLISLQKVLKLCNNDDILSLHYDISDNKLQLIYESTNVSSISHFNINVLDIDEETLSIPTVEYDTTVVMPSFEFSRICNSFKDLGDTIEFSSGKHGIKFSFSSDTTSGNVTISDSSMTDTNEATFVKVIKSTTVSFSLKYLCMFTKGGTLAQTVKIMISDNMPMVVEYAFKEGHVTYYMAPKMDE
tara:strand:+ start:96 stop:869 length:774 start_codon:yes stop_codon:yes gene_type:complete